MTGGWLSYGELSEWVVYWNHHVSLSKIIATKSLVWMHELLWKLYLYRFKWLWLLLTINFLAIFPCHPKFHHKNLGSKYMDWFENWYVSLYNGQEAHITYGIAIYWHRCVVRKFGDCLILTSCFTRLCHFHFRRMIKKFLFTKISTCTAWIDLKIGMLLYI